jgi:hypothetical protein
MHISITNILSLELLPKLWCGGGYHVHASLNNISLISWRSVLLMEETGVLGEKHQPAASH